MVPCDDVGSRGSKSRRSVYHRRRRSKFRPHHNRRSRNGWRRGNPHRRWSCGYDRLQNRRTTARSGLRNELQTLGNRGQRAKLNRRPWAVRGTDM